MTPFILEPDVVLAQRDPATRLIISHLQTIFRPPVTLPLQVVVAPMRLGRDVCVSGQAVQRTNMFEQKRGSTPKRQKTHLLRHRPSPEGRTFR